jgi:predicted O-methyltransferase YrrM
MSTAKHLQANTFGRNPRLIDYVLHHCREHPVQRELRTAIETQDMAVMSGAPDQAAMLGWLLQLLGAKKVLEVGVFRGATTMALALALPADGKVVGLDVSAEYAATALPFWAKAGVDGRIDFRVGRAVDEMDKMIANGEKDSFDLVFVDADKPNYNDYYERALVLVKPGTGVIAIDNVLWDGLVSPLADDADESTRALAAIAAKVRDDKRVSAVMVPVGDGVYLVRRNA